MGVFPVDMGISHRKLALGGVIWLFWVLYAGQRSIHLLSFSTAVVLTTILGIFLWRADLLRLSWWMYLMVVVGVGILLELIVLLMRIYYRRRGCSRRELGTEAAPKEKEAERSINGDDTWREAIVPFAGAGGFFFPMYFLLGILFAATSPPPLPAAELTTKSEGTKKGSLLAHTDTFWYLFDEEGKHKNELIAVPDSEVKSGRVFTE